MSYQNAKLYENSPFTNLGGYPHPLWVPQERTDVFGLSISTNCKPSLGPVAPINQTIGNMYGPGPSYLENTYVPAKPNSCDVKERFSVNDSDDVNVTSNQNGGCGQQGCSQTGCNQTGCNQGYSNQFYPPVYPAMYPAQVPINHFNSMSHFNLHSHAANIHQSNPFSNEDPSIEYIDPTLTSPDQKENFTVVEASNKSLNIWGLLLLIVLFLSVYFWAIAIIALIRTYILKGKIEFFHYLLIALVLTIVFFLGSYFLGVRFEIITT